MPTGAGASRAFAIATSRCKQKGYASFKKGTPGYICRGNIAEGVAKTTKRKRRR